MQTLLDKGQLYCSTLHYFANLKDGNFIGDKMENVFHISTFAGSIEIKRKQTDPYRLVHKGQIQETTAHFAHKSSGNIFCLYFHDVGKQQMNVIQGGNIELIKDWVVVIIDAQEFVNRVANRLKEMSLDFKHHFVSYEDLSKWNGPKGLFTKDRKYKHQQEYRIWIDNPINDALLVEIGPIADIARLLPASELKYMGFKRIPNNQKNHFEDR